MARSLDSVALASYLREHIDGFAGPLTADLLKGGQSNPTYLIETPAQRYVLRRKPPGTFNWPLLFEPQPTTDPSAGS